MAAAKKSGARRLNCSFNRKRFYSVARSVRLDRHQNPDRAQSSGGISMDQAVLARAAAAPKPGGSHYHIFHADANVLSGTLTLPIEQNIEQQIPVALQDRRGGHLTRVSEDFSVEGFISYKRGLTRVSGSPSSKVREGSDLVGWTTLSTSILEGLNVFEVITADRVVSQVATDHAYTNGHVPYVTFLGTQFHNLQVSGFPVTPILDLRLFTKKPDRDLPYVTDPGVLQTALAQINTVLSEKDLPEDIETEYLKRLDQVNTLSNPKTSRECSTATSIKCSLVQKIVAEGVRIPGFRTFGNLMVIPEFGTVALAEVEIGVESVQKPEIYEDKVGFPSMSNFFKTNMLEMTMGCIGSGTIAAGSTKSNGQTKP